MKRSVGPIMTTRKDIVISNQNFWNLGTGMVVMAIPIFTGSDAGKSAGDSVADRTEYYTTAKNLLTSGADAMERLMTAYKVK